MIGFALVCDPGGVRFSAALNHAYDTLLSRLHSPKQDRVLIVTSSPEKQMNVILTMSPRGLTPLFARSLNEVKDILPGRASEIRLAVLDESFPDGARIARSLRSSLPSNHVVVLKASVRPEDIGPLLLNKL